jgi:hypothetical protein
MTWPVPNDKLSERQNEIIGSILSGEGSHFFIKGFAGTGKTLILTRLIESLAARPDLSCCFVTYADTLVEQARTAVASCRRAQDAVPFMTKRSFFQGAGRKYDYILVDEIQDMAIEELVNWKLATGRLVCAGDFNQQIYLHRLTELELKSVLNPVVFELTDIYRLNKFRCKLAVSVSPKTRIPRGLRTCRSPRADVGLMRAETEDDECRWVWDEARALAGPGRASVVLIPSFRLISRFGSAVGRHLGLGPPPEPVKSSGRYDFTAFNLFWERNNINFKYIDNKFASTKDGESKPFVYIMTYHTSKGMNFENLFLPFLCRDTAIVKNNNDLESKLLFTALTRARGRLFISYAGEAAHRLIENMPPDCFVRTGAATVSGAGDDRVPVARQ